MEHVAIMKKSLGMLEKILDGRKKIESRWYVSKHSPWDKINTGDIVYFKNSGEMVTVKSKVRKVVQFPDLNERKVKDIIYLYGKDIGFEKGDVPSILNNYKDKKYCILVYLDDVKRVEPFNIDKTGFGSMSAWICVGDVEKIKK